MARVTGTQEAVNSAGRKSEMAYNMKRRMQELKRDVEKILLENNASVAGTDTSAREVGGLQAWVKTNTDISGSAATGDGTDEHTDGTQRALTESQVEGVLASAWSEGGSPSMGIMNSFHGIGARGSASLAVVAPGISEALIATAIGLLVAIPATIFYNYFLGKLNEVETGMVDFAGAFLNRAEREIAWASKAEKKQD